MLNLNFYREKSKLPKVQAGFTLVELMIALFIVVALGTVIMNIFLTTLRGSKKATAVNKVRETGNFAISQMARVIQYSQVESECNGEALVDITLTTQTGETLRYFCSDTGNIRAFVDGPDDGFLIDGSFAKTAEGSCSFTCTDNGGQVPRQVKIQFTLLDDSDGTLPENEVSIPFNTTVALRNLTQ